MKVRSIDENTFSHNSNEAQVAQANKNSPQAAELTSETNQGVPQRTQVTNDTQRAPQTVELTSETNKGVPQRTQVTNDTQRAPQTIELTSETNQGVPQRTQVTNDTQRAPQTVELTSETNKGVPQRTQVTNDTTQRAPQTVELTSDSVVLAMPQVIGETLGQQYLQELTQDKITEAKPDSSTVKEAGSAIGLGLTGLIGSGLGLSSQQGSFSVGQDTNTDVTASTRDTKTYIREDVDLQSETKTKTGSYGDIGIDNLRETELNNTRREQNTTYEDSKDLVHKTETPSRDIELSSDIETKANETVTIDSVENIRETVDDISFTEEEIANMSTDEITYLLEHSNVDKNGNIFETTLNENDTFRTKVIEVLKSNPNISIQPRYKNYLSTNLSVEEIIDNYKIFKNDISQELAIKILNSDYSVSSDIISDLVVKEENTLILSEYDSDRDIEIYMDLNETGKSRIVELLQNNTNTIYKINEEELIHFGFTNLDIKNLEVKSFGKIISYDGYKRLVKQIADIRKETMNLVRNKQDFSLNDKIKLLEEITNLENSNVIPMYAGIGLNSSIEKIFKSFSQTDLINLIKDNNAITIISNFKNYFSDCISQNIDSIIENGSINNLLEVLKNNSSLSLSNIAYEKIVNNLSIYELLNNYDAVKNNSIFKDNMIRKIPNLEYEIQSLSDIQLKNLLDCTFLNNNQVNWNEPDGPALQYQVSKKIVTGINTNHSFAEKVFSIVESNNININWSNPIIKAILNYDGQIPSAWLEKIASSSEYNIWNATDLNEIGKKRFIDIFNNSKVQGTIEVGNIKDYLDILESVKNEECNVFIEDINKSTNIKDIKEYLSTMKNIENNINLLQKEEQQDTYLSIVNDIINAKSNNTLVDNDALDRAMDVLNDKKYSKLINSMSEQEIINIIKVDVQKDYILDFALNGNNESLVSYVLSEDALNLENKNILNELREKAKVSEGEIAGVDASKVRYTVQINPSILTNKAIDRINNYARNNKDINIALDFKNTSGLTLDMITKLDENILFKIEGTYSNEFLNNKKKANGFDMYIGSEFTSNVFTRGETYAVLSKIEEIESKVNPSWSEKEKAVYLYEILKNSIKYDHVTINNVHLKLDNNSINYPADYASDVMRSLRGIVSGKTVCAGYAVIYQELLNRQGIEAYYESGYVPTTKEVDGISIDTEEGHAWNVLVLDGKKYVCDLTWDSHEETSRDYEFTKSLKEFKVEHIKETYKSLVPKSFYDNISVMSQEELANIINKVTPSNNVFNQLKEKLKRLIRKPNNSTIKRCIMTLT